MNRYYEPPVFRPITEASVKPHHSRLVLAMLAAVMMAGVGYWGYCLRQQVRQQQETMAKLQQEIETVRDNLLATRLDVATLQSGCKKGVCRD